jgi:hypothetical protein
MALHQSTARTDGSGRLADRAYVMPIPSTTRLAAAPDSRTRHYARMGTAEDLARVPLSLRTSGNSIRAEFEAIAPNLDDLEALRVAVREVLERDPLLVDAGRRTATTSDQARARTSTEQVGFFDTDTGRSDVNTHDDPLAACAEFICREVAWVLRETRS